MQNALAHISVADYLAGELRSEIRHEYIDGEVFAMSGASRRHHLIATNLARHTSNAAANRRSCQVFIAGMKVFIEARNVFYYPDLFASCDPGDREDYYSTTPCFVIEILSPSTAAIDRREKRQNYCLLASLREYVLVDQDRRRVDVYRRDDSSAFQVTRIEGSGTLHLSCLDLDISLDDIYEGVELPTISIAEPDSPVYYAA